MGFVHGAFIVVITSLLGFGSCFDLYSTTKYVFKKDDIKPEKSRHSLSEKWLEEIRAHKKKMDEQEGKRASKEVVKTQQLGTVLEKPLKKDLVKTGGLPHKKVDTTQKVRGAGKVDETKIIPDLKMLRPETPAEVRRFKKSQGSVIAPGSRIKPVPPKRKPMVVPEIKTQAPKTITEKPAEKEDTATIPTAKTSPKRGKALPEMSIPVVPPRRAVQVGEGPLPRPSKAKKWKGKTSRHFETGYYDTQHVG